MSFNISGFVRDSVTSVGIANVWLSLLQPNGNCIKAETDSDGQYVFCDLIDIGVYIIYETVAYPNNCPPTVFTQPSGYCMSTTTRVLSVNANGCDICVEEAFEHSPAIVPLTVHNHHIAITKSSNALSAAVGDIITYSLICVNDGGISLENVVVSDLLSPEIEYVEGSVVINNVEKPNESILSGINISSFKIGDIANISFKAKMVMPGNISNVATATYTYKPSYTNCLKSGENFSNINTINIFNVSVSVEKYSNKDFVLLGDTIEYTINVKNTGGIDVYDVLLTDELPKSLDPILGSLSINGEIVNNINLLQGINIGCIPKGRSTSIKFSANVVSSSCGSNIVNIAQVKYSYGLPDGTYGCDISKSSSSCINTIDMAISNFKQLSIENYLKIPSQKPDIEEINAMHGDIEIIKYHTIQTPVNTSVEGQKNSGYKLIIQGLLKLLISYVACESCQSVHSAHYDIPFSTFIILPIDYNLSSKIDIDATIEDIYYKDFDCRTFFTNTTALINAKILSC